MNRRTFLAWAGGAAAASVWPAAAACAEGAGREHGQLPGGRLTFRRPASPKFTAADAAAMPPGQRTLKLGFDRDPVLRVPDMSKPGNATRAAWTHGAPVMLLFHGASGSGENMLGRISKYTDEAGMVVVSLSSTDTTWDVIRQRAFGPDIAMIDRVLTHVFDTLAVDPSRLIAAGFSDGATYALSVGLINGDVFPKVAAFSPGFIAPGTNHEWPKVFVSHGTKDPILPFDRCGKAIAAALKRADYDITFREFDGVHEIPPDVARDALRWMIG